MITHYSKHAKACGALVKLSRQCYLLIELCLQGNRIAGLWIWADQLVFNLSWEGSQAKSAAILNLPSVLCIAI